MKRVLFLFLAVVLIAGLFLLTLTYAPRQVDQAWRAVGLPASSLRQIAALLPGQAAAVLAEPVDRPVALIASGTLEAEETHVASEIGGQVAEVLVDEGEAVTAGQVLLRLDDALLRAQLAEADQAVQTAQANLALAKAEPRSSQIHAAQATLREAKATLEGAKQGLEDAKRARDDLQALNAQIDSARSRIALANRRIDQARARQAAVRVRRESIATDTSDQGQTQRAIYDKQLAAAAEGIAAAEQEAQGARRILNALVAMRTTPVGPDAAVHAAESQVKLAEAGVAVAQAGLEAASAGPRAEAIALAEARLAQAEAARQVLRVQAAKSTIASPLAGLVTARIADPGELASPGSPLLTVADLTQMTLLVYVPEPRIGEVHVGMGARVKVDSYPERVFPGVVNTISQRAEFTPKNVQTQEERVETVVAVEIQLANPDGALKPGMPADAEFVQR